MDKKNAVSEKLMAIFREVFDDDNLEINSMTTAQDVEGWDSLAHIRLVVTIEKAFSMRFTAAEIADLKNVGDMAELILRKQAGA